MNRLILLVESRIRGDVYVRFGGELPKTHRSNTAGRWMLSLPLKSVNNLVKDARKVQQTILMVGDISDIYVTNFNTMTGDPNFTVEELSAIAFGYNRLLKERLDIINRIYGEVLEYKNLTWYYTRKNIGVSYLRSKEKGDAARVLSLYGTHEQRYW